MFCYLSIPVSRLYLAKRAPHRLLPHLPIDLFVFLPSMPLLVLVVFIAWALCMGGSCKNDLYRKYNALII